MEKVKQNHQSYFLGMEHSLVLTLGLRSHGDPLIESYKKLFPEVFSIRRGGHLVIHNPGQLVIYPIVNIKESGLSVRTYLALLTGTTQKLLTSFGIETFEKQEPGLFTGKGKIAMFGVGVRQGITCHGLCINITNDLGDFKKFLFVELKPNPWIKWLFIPKPLPWKHFLNYGLIVFNDLCS